MRPGETMRLEVLALEPKLTFALLGAPAGATGAAVSMSAAIRHLTALLDRLSNEARAAPPPRTMPLTSAPPASTSELAQALQSAVAHSGLFYESHQAQWIAGERPLEELMREPQAALKRTGDAVHPQAAALVQQQLEALDARQLAWCGQVWPEQSLEWRIEEDSREEHRGVEAPPAWKTSLRLALPRLGDVNAVLAVAGNDVRITLTAAAPDARSDLRAGEPALRTAFERAGLELRGLAVPEAAVGPGAGARGTLQSDGAA
jgi:hypothetical protein